MLCHVEDAIPEHRVEVLRPCARHADVEQLSGLVAAAGAALRNLDAWDWFDPLMATNPYRTQS